MINMVIKNADETKITGSKIKDFDKSDSNELVLDLLSPNRSIDMKVNEVFEDLPKSFALILVLPRAQHELRYLRLVKYFTDKNLPGIYITLNKSTSELLEEMKPQGIKIEKIIFIDSVTKMADGAEIKSDNISYLESPDDITELNFECEHAINRLKKGEGFVIVDSITTLLVYNKAATVEKFIHTLSQKVKNLGLQGIFFAAESTDKETLDTISQFCDDIRNL